MEKSLLPKEYIQRIFPEDLIFFDKGIKRRRVNLEKLIKGVGEIIEEEGAVLTYPLVVAIDQSLYHSRENRKRLVWFIGERKEFFEKAGIQRASLEEALKRAFNLPSDWRVRILEGFDPWGHLHGSKILYREEEEMAEYLRRNFEYGEEIRNQRIKYYKPAFSLEGFVV